MRRFPQQLRRSGPFFVLFFAVALAFQIAGGAYRSEFGGHPDEAAHCVTGLFIHDAIVQVAQWISHGFHGSPVKIGKDFAASYYEHYPKIGLGNWPPFFYLLQSAWMLIFSVSRTSLLLLMCALAALLALELFNALRADIGSLAACGGATLLLALPLTQEYTAMMMCEILSAVLMFGAALYFGKYLDVQRPRDAIGFGLCAAFAILTKGTGVALALLPPVAILLTRNFRILKNPALWISGVIVLVLAGPWTWIFRNVGKEKGGWQESAVSSHFTQQALGFYAWKFVVIFGWLLIAFAIIGIIRALRKPQLISGKPASCLALILSVYIFQAIMPVGLEERHLIPALPAIMFFAMNGIVAFASLFKMPLALPASVIAVIVLFFAGALFPPKSEVTFSSLGDHSNFSPFRIPPKGYFGFAAVADDLVGRLDSTPALISSDARGEGMFISEIALRDKHRPNWTIKRSSKELGSSAWSGAGYRARFENEDALRDFLRHFKFIIIDNSVPAYYRVAHHDLIRDAIEHDPEHFHRIATAPISRSGILQSESIHVYESSSASP